jgi:hypothetical protein
VAPALPPPPYNAGGGAFFLEIEGTGSIPLTSFAGCYDKILAREYEDCHFSTGRLAQPILDWLSDTVTATNPIRNVAIFFADQTLQVLSRIDVGNAFLREFRVSAFDAAAQESGSLSFVVVPGSLRVETANPGTPSGLASGEPFAQALFSLSIDGLAYPGVAAIRGLVMSVPKVPQDGPGRRQFVPGVPQFGDISIEVGPSGASLQQLQQWVDAVAAGTATPVAGQVLVLNQSLSVLRTILLTDMVPVAFPPYPTGPGGRRTLIVDLGRFRLQ